MAADNQNPGRKGRNIENDGDGNRFFDSYRFTPFTTDVEFFRDPKIYETKVARSTQKGDLETDSPYEVGPRGVHRTDKEIKEEIDRLLARHGQVDAKSIQVNVNDGIVTLAGNVRSQLERQTAEGIVENVFGVLDIKNQLNVSTG